MKDEETYKKVRSFLFCFGLVSIVLLGGIYLFSKYYIIKLPINQNSFNYLKVLIVTLILAVSISITTLMALPVIDSIIYLSRKR